MTSITDKYDIKEELGRGAFSIVKLAVEKSTGHRYAVKMINKTNVGQDMARLATEMEILKNVNHPNIINLKEIVDTKNCLFIVTELVTGGELFDKIVELGSYSEKDSAILVHKMVSAIDYLHGMGIVHRDLKPENLLLKDEDNLSEVKLADFGLSKIMSQKVMMQTACGTPGYVAPEVLQAKGYDKEVDMWSIGVITYILLCGFPPFYNEKLQELFEQIMRADYDFPEDYWCDISDEAKDFISKLLVVDPKKRMTAKEALEHSWLSGHAKANNLKLDKMKNYVMIRKQQSKVIAGELTF
jgi:calcium/calmodulin-dependent protein kinase I